MNLDEYIGKNLDDILDNADFFVKNKKNLINNVPFQQNCTTDDGDNHDEPSDYYDPNYEDGIEDDDIDEYYDYNNQFNQNQNEIEKEQNEDDYTDDIVGELYQTMYENNLDKINNVKNKKVDMVNLFINSTQEQLQKFLENDALEQSTNTNINNENNNVNDSNVNEDNANEDKYDDGYYFFNLINIFVKYYNKKYNKLEHFFSNIKDNEKGISSQMEMFFDAVVEFKMLKEKLTLENDECMKKIYMESQTDEINDLFLNWNGQIYMFEYKTTKLISPSMLVCLNWIYDNKLLEDDWEIYNLRDI